MDYPSCYEKIITMIRPQSFPIGVKIIKNDQDLPEEATRPSKYGIKISLCQWTTVARRWGRHVGALAEDINCTPCLAGLGMKKLKDPRDLATYFLEMGYFENLELAQAATQKMNLMPPGEIRGMTFFPLDKATGLDPDLVLIYGTPAQMSRLAAGYAYHSGELIESTSTGFGLSCLSSTLPFVSGKPAFIHPSRGERILGGTEECEMALSIPAKQLESLVDGLEKTHTKGSRYPTQNYVLYQPPTLGPMQNLGDKLRDF
jgi:uncharacterized protein (DUF169 family)